MTKIEVGKQYKKTTNGKIVEIIAIGEKKVFYKVVEPGSSGVSIGSEDICYLDRFESLFEPYTPSRKVWINFYKYPNGELVSSNIHDSREAALRTAKAYASRPSETKLYFPVYFSTQEVEVREGEGLND